MEDSLDNSGKVLFSDFINCRFIYLTGHTAAKFVRMICYGFYLEACIYDPAVYTYFMP